MTSAAAAPPKDTVSEPVAAASEAALVPRWGIAVLGVFLAVVGGALVYALIGLWPAVHAATTSGARPATISLFGIDYTASADAALLLLVVIASALGSFVHAATSFTDYVGNRKLATSWIWWYVLRGFIGAALSLLFYFAIRGGFLGTNTPATVINPYGMAAVAGLVGLFSKQATDKLREIFDTLFRTAPGHGDDVRADSIVNPPPVIATLEPSYMQAGSLVALELRGEGFMAASVVKVQRGDGELLRRNVEYVGPTVLRVALLADDVALAGSLKVVVVNPPPGGGTSPPVVLEVIPVP